MSSTDGSWLVTVHALIRTTTFFAANHHSIHLGLYAFSAVLTAIVLNCTFDSPGWRVLAYTLVGVIFAVIEQGALDTLFSPLWIPMLMVPLALWLFLVPNKYIILTYRQ
nr:urea transporter [Salmonella enterica]